MFPARILELESATSPEVGSITQTRSIFGAHLKAWKNDTVELIAKLVEVQS